MAHVLIKIVVVIFYLGGIGKCTESRSGFIKKVYWHWNGIRHSIHIPHSLSAQVAIEQSYTPAVQKISKPTHADNRIIQVVSFCFFFLIIIVLPPPPTSVTGDIEREIRIFISSPFRDILMITNLY